MKDHITVGELIAMLQEFKQDEPAIVAVPVDIAGTGQIYYWLNIAGIQKDADGWAYIWLGNKRAGGPN